MNQPKRNLKIWIPIAAVLCFWLGDWMGYTYELTEGTTTRRLAAALNLNSLLLHPFRLSADAFSLGCGIAAALFKLSKTCPVTTIGGKDSVKGNP